MRELKLHAHAKQVKRSEGKSSVAAAAYRAAEKLYDERTGITHDYTRKQGVEFKRTYLPEDAPKNFGDREILWNAAEKKEDRSNSCTAHELEVGFPYEFNAMQRREAGDQIARELMRRYGCAVDLCLHKPNKNNDERNFHAHILFTSRSFDKNTKDGWAATKFRHLGKDRITVDGKKTTRGQQEVKSLRKFTAGVVNNIAKREGLSVYVEDRSYKDRGIDKQPQTHLGPVANDMEKKGMKTERGDQNENIIDFNKKREEIVRQDNYQKFDQYAGAKRAEFQDWKRDEEIENDRKNEKERRVLAERLRQSYGEPENKWKKEIKELQSQKKSKGISGLIQKRTGKYSVLDEKINDLRLNINDSNYRKKELIEKLASSQLKRQLELEERAKEAEKRVEFEIAKARSTFRDDSSEGRGDQGGQATAKKVLRRRQKQTNEIAKKTDRKRTDRTTSYSGKVMGKDKQQQMKKDNKQEFKVTTKSSKKRGQTKPERNFTPPKGPSLGR